MKVVLKVTVLDRILEKFADAARNNREVDYVVVSQREYDELRSDLRADGYFSYDYLRFVDAGSPIPDKLTYTRATFEFTGKPGTERYPGRYIEVVSMDKFRGAPLYVVPEGYMPR